MNKIKPKDLALVAMVTAILCVLAPITIPLPGLVPLSLATLVLYFAAYLLGPLKATACCIVYLLIGLIGVPVFSGWTAGLAKLAGPTGGYLIGYIFMTFISAIGIWKFPNSKALQIAAMAVGTALLYLFGSAWLSIVTEVPFISALTAGALPFIVVDIIKIVIAVMLGPVILHRIASATAQVVHPPRN